MRAAVLAGAARRLHKGGAVHHWRPDSSGAPAFDVSELRISRVDTPGKVTPLRGGLPPGVVEEFRGLRMFLVHYVGSSPSSHGTHNSGPATCVAVRCGGDFRLCNSAVTLLDSSAVGLRRLHKSLVRRRGGDAAAAAAEHA